MKKILSSLERLLLMSVASFCIPHGALLAAGTVEDTAFDRFKETPASLLRSLYEKTDILVLAEANHSNRTVYERLLQLLREVGNDPRLNLILLERSDDISSVFQDMSTDTFDQVMGHAHFLSDFSRKFTLCSGSHWAYTFSDFMPEITKLNAQRKDSPILVSSFDSLPSFRNIIWPYGTSIDMSSCQIKSQPIYLFAGSNNREQQTADLFSQKILSHQTPGKKMIIVYHHMHALPYLRGCFPQMDGNQKWKTVWSHVTWMGKAIATDPDLRKKVAIALLDEQDDLFNKSGVLRFTKRQVDRYPGLEFAIKTEHLAGVVPETGVDLFQSNAHINNYYGEKFQSTAKLEEFADGIIWTPDAIKKYSFDPRPSYYLPRYCEDQPFFPKGIPASTL